MPLFTEIHLFLTLLPQYPENGSEIFHSKVQGKLPLLWSRKAVSQGLPVIKVNVHGLHLAAELHSEVIVLGLQGH